MRFNRTFATALGLSLALPASEAQANAPSLRYTPQEQQVSIALTSNAAAGNAKKLQALQDLAQLPAFNSTRNQALLAQQQCDLAIRVGLDPTPYATRLAQLAKQAGNRDTAPQVLTQQCELRRLQYLDQPPALDKIWSHYRSVQGIGLPSISYDVATVYSNLAHSYGLLDEALKASEAALAIAKANRDTPNQRNSLMDLAMVQADLGLHADALRNSAAALALGTSKNQAAQLANRGYVQIRADELDAAEATYREVLKLTRQPPIREGAMLSALINLAHIYTIQNRVQENLAITSEAMTVANRLGLPADHGYAESARALALVSAGQVDEARKLFNQGVRHLNTGNETDAVSEYLTRWSQQLGKRQLWEEAFKAAEQARQLNEQINAAQRQRNGQYLSAIHESAQKDQTISVLMQQSRIAELVAGRRKATNIAWGLGAAALALVITILLGSYFRLRKANARLNHENSHDTLTRLHNRAYFTRYFNKCAQQGHGGRAILALLDIDHFKQINDTWGHAAGDDVLQKVGLRLSRALRGDDVIARWGGEEIVVFVHNLHPDLRAQDLAERLRNTFARAPLQTTNHEIPVTVSIGYIEFVLRPDNRLDDLLSQVDTRLYAAKNAGRNRAIGDSLASD